MIWHFVIAYGCTLHVLQVKEYAPLIMHYCGLFTFYIVTLVAECDNVVTVWLSDPNECKIAVIIFERVLDNLSFARRCL